MCQKTVPARKLQKLQLQENMQKAIIARKCKQLQMWETSENKS